MKRIFGGLKMNWWFVILFACAAGIYSSVVTLIPFTKDTSFRDIAHCYEWWVIFAVIIVVNCEKSWEAMLKCFVFFLISQPVWYLVKLVFGQMPLQEALATYRGMWLPMTLLTLPGGFVAYFCKKQNVLGGIVLALGNTILLGHAVFYFGQAFLAFPRHLLSGLFCVAGVIVMSLCIQREKKNRLVAMLLPVVLTLAVLLWAWMNGRTII